MSIYNKDQIKEILPHREPFLFLDSIEEISYEPGNMFITGTKTFTIEEEFFKGHFPGHPVVPGVIILEALAQTGGVMVLAQPEFAGKIALFTSADNVKWRRQVLPGDTVKFKMNVNPVRHNLGKGQGFAYVNGELACQADVKFVLVDA